MSYNQLPSVWQKPMATSLPIVIASDQSVIPVSWPLTDAQARATPIPVSGSVTTGWLTDTQLRATAVPVSGSFFQATQPVSIATMPTTPVTGTFFQATQPVSLATNTPTLQAGANIIGKVGIDQTTPWTTNLVALTAETTKVIGTVNIAASQNIAITGTGGITATKASATPAATTDIAQVVSLSPNSPAFIKSADLWVTVTAAAAAIATLTLPAPAAGLFHYITRIEMSCYTTVARTGTATPVIVTSTNLPGTPSWDFSTAAAIGTTERIIVEVGIAPIKSSVAATATTIVWPATASVIWKIKASYYTA